MKRKPAKKIRAKGGILVALTQEESDAIRMVIGSGITPVEIEAAMKSLREKLPWPAQDLFEVTEALEDAVDALSRAGIKLSQIDLKDFRQNLTEIDELKRLVELRINSIEAISGGITP